MNTSNIDAIARICHEVNRAYCQALGDNSQKPWQEAAEWQRESARCGVQLYLSNPNATPADWHQSWLNKKAEDGWIYGPFKDETNKLHPCMVPFENLPESQRAKDYIFRGVVHAVSVLLLVRAANW